MRKRYFIFCLFVEEKNRKKCLNKLMNDLYLHEISLIDLINVIMILDIQFNYLSYFLT